MKPFHKAECLTKTRIPEKLCMHFLTVGKLCQIHSHYIKFILKLAA